MVCPPANLVLPFTVQGTVPSLAAPRIPSHRYMPHQHAVVIVEDDWIHIQLLTRWLGAFEGSFQVTGSFDTCAEAYVALNSGLACDLLLLDLELLDMNGLAFLETLKVRPFTIIQTAFPDFAVDAYRLAANDYLVKPLEKERFNQSILRFLAQAAPKPTPLPVPAAPDFLLVKSGWDVVRIPISEIIYIRTDRHYLHIMHGQTQTMPMMKLEQLMPHLAGHPFVQVHRSYVIHFAQFTSWGNGSIMLGKHKVPIAEGYKKEFEAFLAKQTE